MNAGSLFPGFKAVQFVFAGLIVLIAAAVIYANLSSQQTRALRTAEVRNLQQWGIALNLYLIENKNQLPSVGETPVSLTQETAWYNVLPPYISEQPLAALPPGSRPRPGEPSLWVRPTTKAVKIWDPDVFYFDYGMNRFLQPTEGARSFRIYEINFPGHVIFLAPVAGFRPAADPASLALPKDRTETVAILFCDGHVQPVEAAVLTAPATLLAPEAAAGVSWFQQ